MVIQKQKKNLRKKIQQIGKSFSVEDKVMESSLIWKQLESNSRFDSADSIMLYWSMSDEVITHGFIEKWYEHKNIVLPSIDGDNLILKKYNGKKAMREGDLFGIPEPIGEGVSCLDFSCDLIIVPGVAFTLNGRRLGRGKAYYDKFLETQSAIRIGVCFSYQLVSSIPTDERDMVMDEVIVPMI